MPTPAEWVGLLYGDPIAGSRAEEQLEAVVAVATAQVRSYTRGRGFDADGNPAEDLATVIATAAVRMLTNPSGTESEAMGALQVRWGSNYLAWNLTELAILNRYRERAK
ncbi:hypothetical protein HZU38_18860 [Mycolicibacterium vanbaalenii]|uniref:hypothetical protein n=1 Tax=Mycolicibacterium vanbaalenii TaxID=110539 RepID=UPI001F3BB222|nr:hypothetical protein [Mycolicibacterium vanbaalenii]UJL27004.1 hypothetical protein HZU38_18860 [Mycolicibacterium vanbaalenii]WND59127.1 hypothetical protein QQA43_12465 [Mycolicibacterium vanbaalenii]